MAQRPEYSSADIEVLTLRDSVLRRPHMCFGDYQRPDWPLVIAAWTAVDMLDYAVAPQRQAAMTLHRGGELSARVIKACIQRSAAARRWPVEQLIQHRMWWHELARSTTVTVGTDGTHAAEPEQVGDRLVWSNVDIVVRLELDPQLIGIAPEMWWQDGLARLQQVFAGPHLHLAADDQLVILDEATCTTLNLG